jgi:hypothetical protein
LKEKSAIWEIIKSVPELATLESDRKNDALNFIAGKLNKLSLKIHSSPFEPLRSGGSFTVNNNFQQAVFNWLSQFKEEHRLGLLISILSLTYITKAEMETLLDVSLEKFHRERELLIRGLETKHLVDSGLIRQERKVIQYALSETAISEEIKQTAHFSYLKDNKPVEGHLINLLDAFFNYSRYLADPNVGNTKEYRDEQWFPALSRILTKLLGSDILIIEDCSFSGTTFKSDLKKLIALIKLAFIPYEKILGSFPPYLPHFYILIPVSTDIAKKEIEDLILKEPLVAKYFSRISTGYVFDDSYRFTAHRLAKSVQHLTTILPEYNLSDRVNNSLTYFHDNFSHKYWSKELLERTKMSPEEMRYGYRGGGWTISTFHNCPNNSLPVFWYPNFPLTETKNEALLKRNEHRSKHDPATTEKINSNISVSVADEIGQLKYYLDLFYEKYTRLLS